MTQRTLDCGKTLHELSDYLAVGRIPRDPHIESCPECLNALQGLARVSQLSHELLAQDIIDLPAAPENWISGIMSHIQNEVRAGRSLPLSHADARVRLSVTEGAVRALIRSVADDLPGIVVGRCSLVGDAETPGAPIEVSVTASVAWGEPIIPVTTLLRERIVDVLARHTELNVVTVDVTVEDLHLDPVPAQGEEPS